jgi:hypothetical protein
MRIVLVLFISLAFTAGAYGRDEAENLRLAAAISGQSYCLDRGSGNIMMKLKFQLKYTNVGRQPLLLYKGSKSVSYIRAARTVEDLTAEKFSIDYSITWVSSDAGDVPNTGSRLDSRFVVLKPGESWEAASLGELRLTINKALAGEHVFQVVISTWGGSTEQAVKLRAKWKEAGYLWVGDVFSVPAPLTITIPQKLNGC